MRYFFRSDSAEISFFDSGAGLPVVFLHPTPLDHSFWQPLVQRLPGVRAIAPDLRGHGASKLGSALPVGIFNRVPDAPVLTMKQLAADIWALMDHLAIADAVFVGCSIGGYVLFELWRQAPERMRGLAFICSKPQPDTPANQDRRVATIAQARAEGGAQIFDGMTQSLIGASARALRPAIAEELRAHMQQTPEALVATQAGLATRPDSVPTVATIHVPVFALCGGEDPAVTVPEMEILQAAPGGCDWHLLANAGHFAAYEQPDTVAQRLGAWLQRF
jgi:3-oxoadipate enol-lactonase